MNDLFDRYEEEHFPRLSSRSAAEQKRLITQHLPPEIGTIKVESFNTQDARRVDFLPRKTPRQANYTIVDCWFPPGNYPPPWRMVKLLNPLGHGSG